MELAYEPNVSNLSSWAVHRLMWSHLMSKNLHHHHHHSLFTHYVFIYNSVMNTVIRRSYRKTGILKIHGIQKKKIDICIHLGSHGASSSRNISFLNRCILPTAEDMNLFIKVTVTPSKGRGKPPNSNIIFCCLSNLNY